MRNIYLIFLNSLLFWAISYGFLTVTVDNFNPALILGGEFFFVAALLISPYQDLVFFKKLRFGAAFFVAFLTALPLFLHNGFSSPFWEFIPALFGIYFFMSAFGDRVDPKNKDKNCRPWE